MPWVGDSLPAQHTIPHSKHQSAQFLTSQACLSCILFLFDNPTYDRCVGIVYRENGIVNRKVIVQGFMVGQTPDLNDIIFT
jgi:endonuclease YncB( thermonuclease family)